MIAACAGRVCCVNTTIADDGAGCSSPVIGFDICVHPYPFEGDCWFTPPYTIHQPTNQATNKQPTNQPTIHRHFCRIASDFAADIASIAHVALLL